MAEVVEHPPQPGGVPARDVVVGDDLVPVADPGRLEPLAEDARVGEGMATRSARRDEVRVEVEEDRTREVARVVGRATAARSTEHPADVDDAQVGPGEPRDAGPRAR